MVCYGMAAGRQDLAGNMLPTLGISGAFDFFPLVVGGVLIVLFSLERIAAARWPACRPPRFGETDTSED